MEDINWQLMKVAFEIILLVSCYFLFSSFLGGTYWAVYRIIISVIMVLQIISKHLLHMSSSCFVLQMCRSSSTFNLNDCAKTSAAVHRSNSLDQPPGKTRVPAFICNPCTPAKFLAHCPPSQTNSECTKDLNLNDCPVVQESKNIPQVPVISQPNFGLSSSQKGNSVTHLTSTSIQGVQTFIRPKSYHPKSNHDVSRLVSTVGFQVRPPASQQVNVKTCTFSESHKDLQVPLDPCKSVVTSPRKETLI